MHPATGEVPDVVEATGALEVARRPQDRVDAQAIAVPPRRRTATDADTNEERDFLMGELVRHNAVSNVRSHTEGDRLAAGHVNRYVTDSVVAVADLAAVER